MELSTVAHIQDYNHYNEPILFLLLWLFKANRCIGIR